MLERLKWLAWIGGGGCIVALGALAGALSPDPTTLSFLSVGQGDCAVFHHMGTTVLIDAGPASEFRDAGKQIVIPRLRELDAIPDLILLSHPDLDHIGGTGALLRAFPSVRVGISACFREQSKMLECLQSWGLNPRDVLWLGPHNSIRLGAFRISIDCPPCEPDEDDNDGSMFVRFADGNASATFSGDAPSFVEEQMIGQENWSSEILKVGHHGSRTSSATQWLQAVNPKYAIISCGRDNRYGHPHRQALDRLNAVHTTIRRTDREGDIKFELIGNRFEPER